MACQKVCKEGRDDIKSEGKYTKPHLFHTKCPGTNCDKLSTYIYHNEVLVLLCLTLVLSMQPRQLYRLVLNRRDIQEWREGVWKCASESLKAALLTAQP